MKGVFIVLTHKGVPGKDGKWNTVEECEFVNKVLYRHYSSATAIIDVLNEKVLKSRVLDRKDSESYGTLVTYVQNNYPEKYAQLMSIISPDVTVDPGVGHFGADEKESCYMDTAVLEEGEECPSCGKVGCE